MHPVRPREIASVAGALVLTVVVAGAVALGSPNPRPLRAAEPSSSPAPASAASSTAPRATPSTPEPSIAWLTILDPTAVPDPTAKPTSAPPTPAPTRDLAWHVPVLMYHLIATSDESGPALPSLVVPPRLFAQQMQTLRAAGWHTITAAKLAADLLAGHRPPPRTFVITIDDGHEDGYSEAFPILQRNGFVATYYVITGRVGMTGQAGAGGYLTRDQIAAMAAAGMEIGDHTVDHVPLASQTDAKALAEITGGAAWINDLLGAAPTTIAYPFGSFDQSVVDQTRALGFSMAFTTITGCRETLATRLAVPRFHVGPSTTPLDLLARLQDCG